MDLYYNYMCFSHLLTYAHAYKDFVFFAISFGTTMAGRLLPFLRADTMSKCTYKSSNVSDFNIF
jgi:hypothetical protein